jgi:hypothetical protein
LVKTAMLLLPFTLSQGLAVTVFHPMLLVSQFVLPVRPVLVTEAALAVPRLQTPRRASRRAETRDRSPKPEG